MAQLDGLATGINNLESLDLGKDFNLISVNIDPRDKPEDAASKKDKYTGRLAKHHARSGWHFLTGKPADIQSLTKAAGFYYTYDAKADQYNHSAMAIAVSPKGKLTRYLYNLSFEPETLKLSLIEASDGTIGTPFDQFTLWCYHYDPLENRYSADARKLLSFAAGACVLVVLGGVAPFWFARRSAKSLEAYRAAALADPSDVDESGTNQPSKSSTPERSP
jgi:protein SCO1/2